jgi:hypothetical protein
MAPASKGGSGGGRSRGGKRKRGGKGGGAAYRQPTLTSVPTGRAAYTETRRWLLERHGPVCAYCERVVPERTITLDHVTPRRGQTAYDRRDNLVLCCKTCNAAKADKPILAFLLGARSRVIALFKYGQHLSHQLVEMVKDLIPPSEWPAIPPPRPVKKGPRRKSSRELFGSDDEHVSPYLDH